MALSQRAKQAVPNSDNDIEGGPTASQQGLCHVLGEMSAAGGVHMLMQVPATA
jgi:hypothetical protein